MTQTFLTHFSQKAPHIVHLQNIPVRFSALRIHKKKKKDPHQKMNGVNWHRNEQVEPGTGAFIIYAAWIGPRHCLVISNSFVSLLCKLVCAALWLSA